MDSAIVTYGRMIKITHSVFGNSENGFKVGLQFTNLSDSATSAIDKFLQASS